jgi:hypothetical protein
LCLKLQSAPMVKFINNIIKADKILCGVSSEVMPSAENNQEINAWLKLYIILLDTRKYLNIVKVIMQKLVLLKCMCSRLAILYYVTLNYTYLELVVRSPVLRTAPIVTFRTANSVRLGSSENNKEHCHNIMAV